MSELEQKIRQLEKKICCKTSKFYDTFTLFPPVGNLNTLYIDKGTAITYIWNGLAYITSTLPSNPTSVYTVIDKTSDYTLLNTDDAITINTTSGSVTLTMPLTPIVGKKFTIFFVTGSNNLIFNGNGNDVQNLPSGVFASTQTYSSATYLNTSFEYVFVGAKWRLI